MAKKSKILSMEDLTRLTGDDLKREVNRVVRLANQRNRRLKAAGKNLTNTPATAAAKRSKPKKQKSLFEIKGKDRNALIKEYKRAKTYMESETSTIKGAQKWYEKIKKSLSDRLGIDISGSNRDLVRLLKVIDKYDDEAPTGDKSFRYAVIEEIAKIQEDNKNISVDKIYSYIKGRLDEIYVEKREKENPIDEFSSPFEYYTD